MIHGDFRADNLFFEADGSVAAVDFQLIGTGRGAYDLAYFVTQSITSEDAAGTSGPCSTAGSPPWSAAGVPGGRPGHGLGRLPGGGPVLPRLPRRGLAGHGRQRPPPAGLATHDARAVRPGGGRARPRRAPLTPGGSDGRWPTLATRNPQASL